LSPTLDELKTWIGRSEVLHDIAQPTPVAALTATLDHPPMALQAGRALPPLWHWLYFLPMARQSEIGPDGHPRRGGFLPPVPLPRRMWAGGRLEFRHPLRVGDEITRVSRIKSVDAKAGRSGTLVFVTVRHEVSNALGLALSEEHDIVYRDAPQPGAATPAPQPAPDDASFSREIVPDPVLLFRYSALTFNGHRIHYDRPYVTDVEGYPGLIVHGPLIATLLVDLLRRERPQATLTRFAFTAVRPIFDIHRFSVCGRADGAHDLRLWARDHEGFLAMRVHVLIRFGRWQDAVDLPLPHDPVLYCVTTAMAHYAKGVAYSATGRVREAEVERELFLAALQRVPASRMLFNNTCQDILAVASAMLDGELEYRKGNHDLAFTHLRRSIELDDSLPYDEPWGWMQPTRHAYGALLLEQGHVEEAAAVYRADLGIDDTLPRALQHPNNVWSLHGYHECLVALGRADEARIIGKQLTLAAAFADVPVTASCFCRLSTATPAGADADAGCCAPDGSTRAH